MKSSLPKRVKTQSKNQVYNVNAKFEDHVSEKNDSYIDLHVCIRIGLYTYVQNSLPKRNLWTWHWHYKPILFWNDAYRVFQRSSSNIVYSLKLHSLVVWVSGNFWDKCIKLIIIIYLALVWSDFYFKWLTFEIFAEETSKIICDFPHFFLMLTNIAYSLKLQSRGFEFLSISEINTIKLVPWFWVFVNFWDKHY